MKFTLNWLKEHLETVASASEIAEKLTMIGLEVEGVEDRGALLNPFIVASVLSAEKHPNADKLKICTVDPGSGAPVKVVCGAPNARAGMKGVFAPPGTWIPGTGFVLEKGIIRGEESNGMLCSGRELMLSDDHTGIIEVPADAPIGASYAAYAGLGEIVFDITITPNRGDCTGVHGVARDLAAAGIGTLKDAPIALVPSAAGKSPIPIELRFGADETPACRMFAGRLIKGVKNGPSPGWLQKRLLAVGLRPINALADITNFISLDRGRPLHVYDADRLKGTVHARMGRAGEKFFGLDGREYEADETMCVIADGGGVLGFGGILGGEASSSTGATVNVLLECAWFDPISIASTGRKTSIVSDARYRFERAVDPEFVRPGLELATRMVLDICGGEACEPTIAGSVEAPRRVIDFPLAEIARLTGLKVPPAEVKSILTRLGFEMTGTGGTVKVSVPSWRADVSEKADLVEEVMRMVGIDLVPVAPLPRLFGVASRMLTQAQNRRRLARRALAARGLGEAITWSFISGDEAQMFGGGKAELKLANPIAADLTDMRPSLLPGLLAAARRNANRGFPDLALFEIGQVFLDSTPAGQRTHAAAIRTGTVKLAGPGRHWRDKPAPVDVFDARADVEATLEALGFDTSNLQLVAEPAPWSHPGRGGRFQLGPNRVIAWFGELHPATPAALDLQGPIAAMVIDLDAIPEPKARATKTRPPLAASDLMPVRRDFAFVVDRDVEAAAIIKAARAADKTLIADVAVFDVFEGTQSGAGKKSVAIEVTLQPRDRTLTDEEIEAVGRAIVAAVGRATGASLRT
ncbi:MAG: phenylalanine--tRNA ligase subunit beta [Cucumibacter sp.]